MGTSSRGRASSSTATGGLGPGWGGAQGLQVRDTASRPWWVWGFCGPRLQGSEGLWGPVMFGVSPSLGMWGPWLEGGVALRLQPLCTPTPSTILVEPGCQAEVTESGDIRISVGAEALSTVGAQLDPIHLSIFSHRFMSIAGEWGSACWAEVGAGAVVGRGVQTESSTRSRGRAVSGLVAGRAVGPWLWVAQPPCTSRPWAGGRCPPASSPVRGLPSICGQEMGSAQ